MSCFTRLSMGGVTVQVPHGAPTFSRENFVMRVSPGGGADEEDQALTFSLSLEDGAAGIFANAAGILAAEPRVVRCHQGACALDVALTPGAVGASKWRVVLSDDGGAVAAPAFFELRVLAPPPSPPLPATRTDLPGLVVTVQLEPPALPPPAVTALGVTAVGVSSDAAPSLAPVAPVLHRAGRALLEADPAADEPDAPGVVEGDSNWETGQTSSGSHQAADAPGVVEGGAAGARKLLQAEALRFQMAVERP